MAERSISSASALSRGIVANDRFWREADIESELARWDCPQKNAVRVSALPGANCAFGSTIGAASLSGSLVRTRQQEGCSSVFPFWACTHFLGLRWHGRTRQRWMVPRGRRIFGILEPSTGCQESSHVAKMGKLRTEQRREEFELDSRPGVRFLKHPVMGSFSP